MLTIHTTKKGRCDIARITVTDDMTVTDRGRLASLANVMSGFKVGDYYEFTKMRGEKAWLLFRHGFQGVAEVRHQYVNDRSITHTEYGKRFHLSHAVAIARIMEAREEPAEATI